MLKSLCQISDTEAVPDTDAFACQTRIVFFMLSRLWEEPTRKRKRGRGGWRQQALQHDVAGEAESNPSRLGIGLFKRWCDGDISAAALATLVQEAIDDGFSNIMLVKMQKAGKDQNSHSGLMALLGECKMDSLLSAHDAYPATHMVLPSAWARAISMHYPREFRLRFGADEDRLLAFWQGLLARPLGREMASRIQYLNGKTPSQLKNTIPLVVHEDAGPCSKSKSANCISFSSLLGIGSEKSCKYLVSTYLKNRGDRSQAPWIVVLNDLDKLANGDIMIECFDKLWDMVLLFAKADEETRSMEFGLASYNDVDEVCSECLCNRSGRPFTDLQRTSLWRPTERMPYESYIARIADPLHPLAQSKYMHRFFFFLDIMHMIDCKGAAAIVFGALLFYILALAALGATRQERIDRVNAWLDEWYSRRPGLPRLPKLLLSNMTLDGWAELHGKVIKAAATRHAAEAFADMAEEFLPGPDPCNTNLRIMLRSLQNIYKAMYGQPMFLSVEALRELESHCFDFGESFQRLREHGRTNNHLVCRITPKVHKMQHVPYMAELINPAFVQVYGEESLVGTTTKVYKKSMSGRYRKALQRTVLRKRVAGFFFNLEMR